MRALEPPPSRQVARRLRAPRGEISVFAHEPGTRDMAFARDRACTGVVVSFFVIDQPAADCSAGPPSPRREMCPVVVRDQDACL